MGLALEAAARHNFQLKAIVCADGGPSPMPDVIRNIGAPVLFIGGAGDQRGISRLQDAMYRLSSEGELRIIPEADARFSDPGHFAQVLDDAVEWFCSKLFGNNS